MNTKEFGKMLRRGYQKHNTTILTGFGMVGMLSAGVMAVRATPKALMLIEDRKCDLEVEKLTKRETVKTVWRCYLAPVLTATVSATCLLGANKSNVRKNAALTAGYALSETASKEYQAKVLETIGEKKERGIRDAIAKDHVENIPVSKSEVIITKKGDTLSFDVISGRYFKSNIDCMKAIENEMNERLLNEGYVSLNDLYYELGLSELPMGSELGWRYDDGLIKLVYSSQIADNNEPCIVLDYRLRPKAGYDQ